MIRLLAVGKRHDRSVVQALEGYQRRLRQPWQVEWLLVPHSSLDGPRARQDESERLLQRLPPDTFVVLLDERGRLLDSPALSRHLMDALAQARLVTLVIGGAYGVDERVRQRANLVWSLSPLVFPHQLVRLIVMEQLYRAQEIAAGRPYHHE